MFHLRCLLFVTLSWLISFLAFTNMNFFYEKFRFRSWIEFFSKSEEECGNNNVVNFDFVFFLQLLSFLG